MNNLISLKRLSKSFSNNKKISVLKKINYSFTKGKIYSLMGPSGSGKSTLLNILSMIDTPTSGSLLINNNTIISIVFFQTFVEPNNVQNNGTDAQKNGRDQSIHANRERTVGHATKGIGYIFAHVYVLSPKSTTDEWESEPLDVFGPFEFVQSDGRPNKNKPI